MTPRFPQPSTCRRFCRSSGVPYRRGKNCRRFHPVALKGRLRLLMLLPVAGGRAFAADHEGSNTPSGSCTPSSSMTLGRVARHFDSRGAGPAEAGTVREKDVEHFGRADAIDNLEAEPPPASGERSRAAAPPPPTRRSAATTGRNVWPRPRPAASRRTASGHRSKSSDDTCRLLRTLLPDRRGREHNRLSSDAERKRETVAETVREEQFGGRQAAIVLVHLQHAARIPLDR